MNLTTSGIVAEPPGPRKDAWVAKYIMNWKEGSEQFPDYWTTGWGPGESKHRRIESWKPTTCFDDAMKDVLSMVKLWSEQSITFFFKAIETKALKGLFYGGQSSPANWPPEWGRLILYITPNAICTAALIVAYNRFKRKEIRRYED